MTESSGVLIPPPLLYGGGLAVGLALDRLLRAPRLPSAIRRPIGVPLILGGGLLGIQFVKAFRHARTPVDLRKPSTSLVTTGPYQVSRNPGYVSLTALYAGAAALSGGVFSFAMLVPVVVLMNQYVIRREERYLKKRFGRTYDNYRARVRRWL